MNKLALIPSGMLLMQPSHAQQRGVIDNSGSPLLLAKGGVIER